MIKIMDGTDSEPYATFVDLTIRAFLACRDNMDKLLDPVVLMFNSGLECFRDNSITNFVDRFRLDLTEDEAAIFMRDLIKGAENNWRTNIYDYIQKKQNNINY
jgi:phosphatidylinositol 4-kinase